MSMQRAMEVCGVEPENRTRVMQVVTTMKRAVGFETCDFVTVAEGSTVLVKFFNPRPERCTARLAFAPLAEECKGIKDATIRYPTTPGDSALELHVEVLKRGKSGTARYEPSKLDDNYLKSELHKLGGDSGMAWQMLHTLDALTSTVLTYAKPSLRARVTYARGASNCGLSFAGMRECTLSFVEYMFEKVGKHLAEISFRAGADASGQPERTITLIVDMERALPDFPKRKETRDDESSERSGAKRFKADS